jgi:hypothetical protein
MISKKAGFAKYSKTLCWFVSVVWLLLSVLSFTGEAEADSSVVGILWLLGAIAFAISAILLGRTTQTSGEGSAE